MAEDTCIVYCRSWCGDCMRALAWMRRMGYDFTEIDIEERPEYADRVRELAGKIVTPTFEIGDEAIVGFDPYAVREALGEPPAV